MERPILLTGKGCVGKTSLAAAHAVASAGSGKRTLLASMDAAHNLSDLFDSPPAPEPTEVTPNLEITEVDAGRVAEEEFTVRVLRLGNRDRSAPRAAHEPPRSRDRHGSVHGQGPIRPDQGLR